MQDFNFAASAFISNGMRRKRFDDPLMELQFQRDRASSRIRPSALAAAVGLAVQVWLVIVPYFAVACHAIAAWTNRSLCNAGTAASAGHNISQYLRTSTTVAPFLSDVVFSGSRYRTIGPALTAATAKSIFVLTMVPSSWLRHAVVWRHRLLFIHFAAACLERPADFYWVGGVVSWLIALAVDGAALPEQCGQSFGCLCKALRDNAASSLTAAAIHPIPSALQFIATLCSRDSLAHLSSLLAPWLWTLYIEYRARRAWLATQQRRAAQTARASEPCTQHQQQQLQAGPSAGGGVSCSKACPAGSSSSCTGQSAATASNKAASGDSRQISASQHAVQEPAIVAAAAAAPAARRPLLEYNSPLHHVTISLKLQPPADAQPADYQLLKQKLISALQSHISSATASSNPTAADAGSASTADARDPSVNGIVTQYYGFRGCWQAVMKVTSSRTAAGRPNSQQQQELQDTMQHKVVQDMPDWKVAAWQQLDDASSGSAVSAAAIEPDLKASVFDLSDISLNSGVYISPVALRHAGTAGSSASSSQSSSKSTPGALKSDVHIPSILTAFGRSWSCEPAYRGGAAAARYHRPGSDL